MSSPVVLVVGDSWYDQSSSQPRPTADGAAGVARHLLALGESPMVVTPVANDNAGKAIVDELQEAGIPSFTPVVQLASPTVTAETVRILHGSANSRPYEARDAGFISADEPICDAIQSLLQSGTQLKAIAIVDLGNGTITSRTFGTIGMLAMTYKVPCYVYCRSLYAPYYNGAKILMFEPTIGVQALEHVPIVHPGLYIPDQAVEVAALKLQQLTGSPLVVTRPNGCSLLWKQVELPGVTETELEIDDNADLQGADFVAFAAILAKDMEQPGAVPPILSFGTAAMRWFSRRNGFASPSKDDVEQEMYVDRLPYSKLMDLSGVMKFSERLRKAGKRVVLAVYPFDDLSSTDVEKLRAGCTHHEDVLIAAYWSDAMLASRPGGGPTVPDSYRATHLALLTIVDAVCRVEDPETLVRLVRPDTLLVPRSDVGAKWTEPVAHRGGEVLDPPIAFRVP